MKQRRKPQISLKTIAAACLVLLSLLLVSAGVNMATAQQPPADLVALKTSLPLTVDGIPGEPFWGQIPALYVPLKGTTPYGGKVPQMWMKAAHNGTHLYLLLQWPDSKEGRPPLYPPRRIAPSSPGNLGGGFFYNETYYYTDAAAITWWMGTDKPSVNPATNEEFAGSPTRRATLFGWGARDKAEMWVWKGYALDGGNPAWPYSAINPNFAVGPGISTWHWGPNAGKPYMMPYSSAFQSIFNATGNWVLGDGLLHVRECQQPGTKPFEIRARGIWSGGMWTVELARSFVPSRENRPYTVTFEEGKTYWIVSTAFDGNKGEWEEVGSMSNWLSLTISKEFGPLEKQTQDALAAASEASKAAQDALSAVQALTTMTYAAIGVAVVAIAISVIGLRKREA